MKKKGRRKVEVQVAAETNDMINALSVSLAGADNDGLLRAARAMERQGFENALRIDADVGTLCAWAHPAQREVANCIVRTASGIACCVGPLWYRGRFGAEALPLLVEEVAEGGCVDEVALRGNFALYVRAGNHHWLLNDALGLVRIYASGDDCFYSTSWLAVCAYLGRLELDDASAVEYVLLGAAHSDQTVARGVTLLPLGHGHDLGYRRTWRRFPGDMVPAGPDFRSFEEAVEVADAHLRRVFEEIAAAFPGAVNTALSGGFDSRLIVAGLLASGAVPRLFVYGAPRSADATIAKAVAAAVDLPISAVDKTTMDGASPPSDVESLARSMLFFDGLPNDGLHDAGADQRTRLQQNAAGCIALNGGGGEVFRNFFHLPDRHFSAESIVRTFYRGFDPAVFRHSRALAAYEGRLADNIAGLPGIRERKHGARLDRSGVELAYPLFRCHYWMGANNSISVRHGYYATPLVDLGTVRLAHHLPMAWKNAGRFEGRLIAGLNRRVAEQPSEYGFRFTDGPGRRARFSEWAHCMRPVPARWLVGAGRRSLRGVAVSPDMIRHYRTLLPGEWRLDPLLDLGRLPDNFALARALAVEVVWRELA